VLLLAQALRGEPLLAPGTLMLTLFAIWATGSAAAIWFALAAPGRGAWATASKAAAVY
jgi:hypothetical protein